MLTARRTIIALAAVILIAGAMPALAQEASMAQGQLVRVDTHTNTIEIKTAAGADMQFRYTDQTRVTGASEGVSGLATMAGADVIVHYTKQAQENIASSITVNPKK